MFSAGCAPSDKVIREGEILKIRKQLIEKVLVPIAKEYGYQDHRGVSTLRDKLYLVPTRDLGERSMFDSNPYGWIFTATKYKNVGMLKKSQVDSEDEIPLMFSIDPKRFTYGMTEIEASISKTHGDFTYPFFVHDTLDVSYGFFKSERDFKEETEFARKMFSQLEKVKF